MKTIDITKRVEIGQGWSWDPVKDYYVLNEDDFFITRDVVEQYMKDWGRKIEKAHIIAVLQKLYRMHEGLE